MNVKKMNPRGGTLCEEGVIIEVSVGMGGREILSGTSKSKKIIWWHRL